MGWLVVVSALACAAPSTAQTQTDPKRLAVQEVERLSGEIGATAGCLWTFSETALRETRSAALLADLLQREGFQVERGVAGMPTAFVATWGSVLAMTGVDLLTQPKLLAQARADFEKRMGGTPYRSPIPTGQKPPLP
jgi:aminobenzoyl-glutamate utilization protein B